MCEHGELVLMNELGPHGRLIDKCMKDLIRSLQRNGVKTLGCCCGHGVYPRTIIVETSEGKPPEEYYSRIPLVSKHGKPRTRNFYKMDKNGLYYLPERSREVES